MDAQRALLDELMGRNRDGDKPDAEVTDYRDKRVCKKFLCGLCPHDLFQNTKMDPGPCPKLHMPNLRAEYEKDSKTKDFGYEQELEKELLKFIADVERKIQRAQKRLEEQDGERAPSLMDFENCKEVLEITAEIQEVMQKAEEAGNEGEVDLSMELMQKVEELKQKKATAQANAMLQSIKSETDGSGPEGASGEAKKDAGTVAASNVNQKLRVCDVCGAFLSIFDSDRRLADHFGGKLHLGYLQIRKKIEEIGELRGERRRATHGGDPKPTDEKSTANGARNQRRRQPRGRSTSRSRSRSRRQDDRSNRSRGRHDRARSRSRDRHRDHRRDRDRGSRRRRRRSSSSSRSSSRSRSRSRGRRR